MNIPRYLSCLLFLLPAAVIAQSPPPTTQPVQPACWEPLSSTPLPKSACYFDAKKLGQGLQGMKLGHVETSQDDKQASCVYSSKDGGKLTSKTFRWLRFNKEPVAVEAKLPFSSSLETFISKIPYCTGTLPRNGSKVPIIPLEYQQSQADDDYICRRLSSGKLVIGLQLDDGVCEDTLGIVYSDSAKPAFAHKIAADWHVLYTGRGWPVRVAKNGQTSKTHFDCPKHCKGHAKNEAERLGHRYAGYDGDHWYTGQRVDADDIDRDNILFENQSQPEE